GDRVPAFKVQRLDGVGAVTTQVHLQTWRLGNFANPRFHLVVGALHVLAPTVDDHADLLAGIDLGLASNEVSDVAVVSGEYHLWVFSVGIRELGNAALVTNLEMLGKLGDGP